jgi:hypothetical protein
MVGVGVEGRCKKGGVRVAVIGSEGVRWRGVGAPVVSLLCLVSYGCACVGLSSQLRGFNAARAAKCPGAIRQWLS